MPLVHLPFLTAFGNILIDAGKLFLDLAQLF